MKNISGRKLKLGNLKIELILNYFSPYQVWLYYE